MNVSELRKKAFSNYKKHVGNSWILSIICCVFIAAILFLSFINSSILFLAVPLVVLPFFFSCIMNHFGFTYNSGDLNFKGITNFFSLYFKPPFFGCFNIIKSFLKMILVRILSVFVVSLFLYFIFNNNYPEFNELVLKLSDLFADANSDINDLYAIFEESNYLLYKFFYYSSLSGELISTSYFVFLVSKESFSIPFRANAVRATSGFVHLVNKNVIRDNRKEFYKGYFGLNWPICALFVIGLALGMFITFNLTLDPNISISIGLSGAIILSVFYLPFYFANMEVLYSYFEKSFKKSCNDVTAEFLSRMKNQQRFSEQQKEEIDDLLSKLDKSNKTSDDSNLEDR